MRIIILSIALLFCAFSAQSQVLKSAGVWYFLDVDSMTARPAVLPNGTEIAYVVGTKTVYYWNRNTSTWTAYGSTFNRDSIYFDSSIVGSGTVSDPWGVDSTLFATISGVGDSIAAAVANYFPLQGGLLTGTGGNGFVGFPSQSGIPSTPANGFSIFGDNTGRFSWIQSDGYLRTLISSSTVADRGYRFQNKSYTLADSADVAALPTGSGTTNYYTKWSSSSALGIGNLFDNNTAVSILNSKPFQLGQWTTAGRPTGTTGYKGLNTTTGFEEGYFNSQWENYITSIGASANWIPTFSSAGKIQGTSTFTQVSNKLTLGVPSGKNPMVDIVTGTGDGTVNEAAGLRLRNRDTDGNTFYLQLGTSTSGRGGSNQGHAYIQSGLWGGSYINPLILMPKGGNIAIGGTRPINWELSVTSNIAVSAALASASTSNTDGGRIVFNAGTVAGTAYNSAVVSIASVFDKSFWYQGTGLSFRTLSGADLSGTTTGGTERMRISSDGNIGIGTSSPQRLFHVAGEARITDLTTDTPTRFVGADADGDLGGISLNSVWRDYQTDKAILGTDSSFIHDPAVDTTKIGGTIQFGKPPTVGRSAVSGYQFTFRNPNTASTYVLIESGRTSPTGGEAALDFRSSGIWGSTIGYGTTTSKSLQFYNYNNSRAVMFLGSSGFVSGNSRTVIVGGSDDPIQWSGNGGLVVFDTITSGKALFLTKKQSSSSIPIAMFSSAANDRFTFNDDGTTRFHVYGTSATTATALSKTESGYLASFATDGTVLSKADNTERYNNITSTTSPVTLSSTIADNLINQGSTQATFTLKMPASPVDGQVLYLTYNNAITTLTIDGNGNTIVGSAVTTAVAGSQRKFKFYSGIGWIKQY